MELISKPLNKTSKAILIDKNNNHLYFNLLIYNNFENKHFIYCDEKNKEMMIDWIKNKNSFYSFKFSKDTDKFKDTLIENLNFISESNMEDEVFFINEENEKEIFIDKKIDFYILNFVSQ